MFHEKSEINNILSVEFKNRFLKIEEISKKLKSISLQNFVIREICILDIRFDKFRQKVYRQFLLFGNYIIVLNHYNG